MPEPYPIKVMLVDDHEIVRRGLESYLQGNDAFVLIASVDSGAEALHICQRVQPDIVLMDVVMPQMDGIETTRRLIAIYPGIKILAFSGFYNPRAIREMVAVGAVGFLLKTTPIDDLQHLLSTLHAGRMAFSPEVARLLFTPTHAKNNAHDLTVRELEVLALVVTGYNNQQIAVKLFVSRSTIGFHVSAILSKLGVSNRVEAAHVATRERLVARIDEADSG